MRWYDHYKDQMFAKALIVQGQCLAGLGCIMIMAACSVGLPSEKWANFTINTALAFVFVGLANSVLGSVML